VSANPPKNDAWRPYADVRFVLIRNPGRLKPSRGLGGCSHGVRAGWAIASAELDQAQVYRTRPGIR